MSVEHPSALIPNSPSFLRPVDGISAHTHTPRSRARRRSPLANQTPFRPPSPQPIPIPSPSRNAQSLAEMEYMRVDPDEASELGLGSQPATVNRRKGFVGGFVGGLKRLPRTLAKAYQVERRRARQEPLELPVPDTAIPSGSVLPPPPEYSTYGPEEFITPGVVLSPSRAVISNPDIVTPPPAPQSSRQTPIPRPAPLEDELEYVSQPTPRHSHHSQRSGHTQPTHHSRHSLRQTPNPRPAPLEGEFEYDNQPTPRHSQHSRRSGHSHPTHHSYHSQRTQSQHASLSQRQSHVSSMATHQEALDDEQTAILNGHPPHLDPEFDVIDGTTAIGDHRMVPSPLPPMLADSPPFSLASDYDHNLPLPVFARPFSQMDDSFLSHLARIYKIFHDFNALPWMANGRVTMDYIPGQSDRGRQQSSWYPPMKVPSVLDLTSSPPEIPPESKRRRSSAASGVSRYDPRLDRTQSLFSRQMHETMPPPPDNFNEYGLLSYPGGYAPYPLNANSEQPMYVYPNGMMPVPASGTNGRPEMRQGVPVYALGPPVPPKYGYNQII